MKHLLNKRKFSAQGGGKSRPKPKPPVLQPPKLGIHQLASSFTYAEVIDLISDGPIKGLVNRNGSSLKGLSNLQGIYLDGTAIAETDDETVSLSSQISDSNFQTVGGVGSVENILNELATDIVQRRSIRRGAEGLTDGFLDSNRTFFQARAANAHADDGNIVAGGELNIFGFDFTKFSPVYAYLRDHRTRIVPGFFGQYGLRIIDYIGPRNFSVNLDVRQAGTNDFLAGQLLREPISFLKHNSKEIYFVAFNSQHPFNVGNQQWRSDNDRDFIDANIGSQSRTRIVNEILQHLTSLGGNKGLNNIQFSDATDTTPQEKYINNLIQSYGMVESEVSILENITTKLEAMMNSDTQLSQRGVNEFSLSSTSKAFIVIDGTEINFISTSGNTDAENIFLDDEGNVNLLNRISFVARAGSSLNDTINFLYPILDSNGVWSGAVGGFLIIALGATTITANGGANSNFFSLSLPRARHQGLVTTVNRRDLQSLINIQSFGIGPVRDVGDSGEVGGIKYNYSNILSELKIGSENQEPLKYFSDIFIDHEKNTNLLGPFKTIGQVQTINDDGNILTQNYVLNDPVDAKQGLPLEEGSNDDRDQGSNRGPANFSDWDNNTISFDEDSIPVTHIVENPNVDKVFVTLQVSSLFDTAIKSLGSGDDKLNAGDKFPGVLNIEVELGKLNLQGQQEPTSVKRFQIIALVEGATIIDIGNPDSKIFEDSSYKYISEINNTGGIDNTFEPFILPKLEQPNPSNTIEGTKEKRYVKITKLSTETNSVLVSKTVDLVKVTEIINVNCSYPFSSLVGLKIDSRTFSNIPDRTFEARLKKVKIPNNYYPLQLDNFEKDKRYYNTEFEFSNASDDDKLIYVGDWDGGFRYDWTDNPAWILYDLLTSHRYGLGQHIDENKINKWELYKIGRFCDAVDDLGRFVGVKDGRGGLEPRYSCNIMFQEGTKTIDSINIIANLFRGSVYYNQDEINFLDDRLRDPVALFSNSNVKDSLFTYANQRRDEQFNAIEVVYIDRFDDYKTKIEYIEDEEDIAQRGLFKKQINALGITSRAMANRVGQHFIFQTIKENQTVSFTTGGEALLCKPGDLIIIEDELKSLESNFGRVLAINTNADGDTKTLRLSEPVKVSTYTSGITVYSPTGQQTQEDLETLGFDRQRLTGFQLTGIEPPTHSASSSPHDVGMGTTTSNFSDFVSDYKFSGYSAGYSDFQIKNEDPNLSFRYEKSYPVYTGSDNQIIYFRPEHTGWVFALNKGFQDNTSFDKFISQTGTSLAALNTGFVFSYANGGAGLDVDRRSQPPLSSSGIFANDVGQLTQFTKGVVESEIDIFTKPQIVDLAITGIKETGFGSIVLIDKNDVNVNLVDFIPVGSPYRIKRKTSDDQVYKIISIREDNPNEFGVVATKYKSGKFDTIENSISIEEPENTFGYTAQHEANGVIYETLSSPQLIKVGLTDFPNIGGGMGEMITGSWRDVSNATGYKVLLRSPNLSTTSQTIASPTIGATQHHSGFFSGITSLGPYTFSVAALGDRSAIQKRYYDSDFSVSGIVNLLPNNFVLPHEKSMISDITIR
tara:strand:+ start:9095 stop:13780 length:4686 start_codon:yes stop_codon:yes gene_type:complete